MGALLAALALSLLVIAAGAACTFALTRWNLEALGRVQPLSREAVALAWSYAWGFTAVIVLTLVAIALILAVAEAAWRYRFP